MRLASSNRPSVKADCRPLSKSVVVNDDSDSQLSLSEGSLFPTGDLGPTDNCRSVRGAGLINLLRSVVDKSSWRKASSKDSVTPVPPFLSVARLPSLVASERKG